MSVTSENGTINPTLNYLRASKALSKTSAIVAADNSGDYLLLSAAIAAGEKRIIIKNGTYNEPADITLTNEVITGESKENTKIVMQDSGIFFKEGLLESAGTITVTYNSKTITGVGTSFTNITDTENLYLVIGGATVLKVASISNNTSLALKSEYRADTTAGLSFELIAARADGARLERLSISNSALTSIKRLITFSGANVSINDCILSGTYITAIKKTETIIYSVAPGTIINSEIRNVTMEGGDYGCLLRAMANTIIENVKIASAVQIGIELNAAHYCKILNCTFIGIGSITRSSNAIKFANSHKIVVDNCVFSSCFGDNGILQPTGTNHKITINKCHFVNCSTAALKGIIEQPNSNAIISNNIIELFEGIGIRVNGNSSVTGNVIKAQTALFPDRYTIEVVGEETVVSNNYLEDGGIRTTTAANYLTISNNAILSPKEDAIRQNGNNAAIVGNTINGGGNQGIAIVNDKNVVSGNNIQNCTGTGILISGTADRSCITGNISLQNGTNYSDLGTNTSNTGNIFV